jgi:N-methylhydantoinase A/oxoprolinase/acetone carboxylase beta subunit
MIRIGIDVGGTNTDAVLMDGNDVLAGVKAATSPDVMTGVVEALRMVLDAAGMGADKVDVVMIGTTHFTNAVVQRRDLAPTAAVRLCLPATASLPPMVDWPADLREVLGHNWWLAHGGNEFDGRVISKLDPEELRGIAAEIRAKGIKSVAITSVFSPVSTEFEREAGRIMAEALPEAHITLSSDIGRIGLLERENAAIMNACLRDLSRDVVQAFRGALRDVGFHRAVLPDTERRHPDGRRLCRTVPGADLCVRPYQLDARGGVPVGRQGCHRRRYRRHHVDVGSLQKGFPRQATVAVEVGGVRTNFRMPDVFSIGLGGGSLVIDGPDGVTVGPRSVGYRIVTEALLFGGSTLTTSDIVVADGGADLGDKAKVAHLAPDLIRRARDRIAFMLEDCVERARISAEPLPVIVVGGGSILVEGPIAGLELIKPNHFAVANAVGAAIAQVSGEVDRVYALAEMTREAALNDAKAQATAAAVAAGRARGHHRDRRRRGCSSGLSSRQCDAGAREGRG